MTGDPLDDDDGFFAARNKGIDGGRAEDQFWKNGDPSVQTFFKNDRFALRDRTYDSERGLSRSRRGGQWQLHRHPRRGFRIDAPI